MSLNQHSTNCHSLNRRVTMLSMAEFCDLMAITCMYIKLDGRIFFMIDIMCGSCTAIMLMAMDANVYPISSSKAALIFYRNVYIHAVLFALIFFPLKKWYVNCKVILGEFILKLRKPLHKATIKTTSLNWQDVVSWCTSSPADKKYGSTLPTN